MTSICKNKKNPDMASPKRKPTRLKGYDYSQSGYYFVTICTKERKQLLSTIVGRGLAPAENQLSPCGKIAKQELLAMEARFPGVKIDKYVIMPNHIHAIIAIKHGTAGASPCPTLSDIVCAFKSITTRKSGTGKLFQDSFHDHIIRGEADYQEIWNYIDTNPDKWRTDCFFSQT